MHKKATSNNYLTEVTEKKECLEGNCTNGKGKQKITTSIGNYRLFEGTFKNGKLNGQGKYTLTTDGLVNRIHEGSFKDGKLNGQGKLTATKRAEMRKLLNKEILKMITSTKARGLFIEGGP
jgi:hypothetical protein